MDPDDYPTASARFQVSLLPSHTPSRTLPLPLAPSLSHPPSRVCLARRAAPLAQFCWACGLATRVLGAGRLCDTGVCVCVVLCGVVGSPSATRV
eukprot:1377815-Rhodomonas_salina.1